MKKKKSPVFLYSVAQLKVCCLGGHLQSTLNSNTFNDRILPHQACKLLFRSFWVNTNILGGETGLAEQRQSLMVTVGKDGFTDLCIDRVRFVHRWGEICLQIQSIFCDFIFLSLNPKIFLCATRIILWCVDFINT